MNAELHIEKKRIADMNRAAYNPRVDLKPGDPEFEAISRSIDKYTLVQPVVWNSRTNTVVSGHQRLSVLESKGITEVDVSVVDLDIMQEKELNIALNKISGEFDNDKLPEVLKSLGEAAQETGFTQPEIDVLREELSSFFDDEPEQGEDAGEDEEPEFFPLTLFFHKADEKAIKSYIKKNGEESIVDTIIQTAKGD